jgi:RWP-RK domain
MFCFFFVQHKTKVSKFVFCTSVRINLTRFVCGDDAIVPTSIWRTVGRDGLPENVGQNWEFVATLLSPFRTQQHHALQLRRGAVPFPSNTCGSSTRLCLSPHMASSSSAADVSITREQLTKYFHLPITDVAKELGICATMLKKICRKNGIPRWPHRKVFIS